MATTVINIRNAPEGWKSDPNFVYIGRAMPRRGLSSSRFANPFAIGRDAETREDAMKLYRQRMLEAPPEFMEEVRELKDKTLVCWCAPEACHGDVLAAIADGKEW